MKIYISGPISNIPEGNKPSFLAAAEALEARHENVITINPHDNGLPSHAPWEAHMRADIRMLLECKSVAMLPGWHNSKGARLERDIAIGLGMDVRSLEDWLS